MQQIGERIRHLGSIFSHPEQLPIEHSFIINVDGTMRFSIDEGAKPFQTKELQMRHPDPNVDAWYTIAKVSYLCMDGETTPYNIVVSAFEGRREDFSGQQVTYLSDGSLSKIDVEWRPSELNYRAPESNMLPDTINFSETVAQFEEQIRQGDFSYPTLIE